VQRFAKRILHSLGSQGGLELAGIPHDPDRIDFWTVLERTHDVGDKRKSIDFEIDLALTVDRFRRAAISGHHDRGDTQRSVSF
jgi:hypothetical protein